MEINKIQKDINRMNKKINNLKNKSLNKIRKVFAPVFIDFLKENPAVRSIYWDQYTPYFNDGDQCIFSVGELQLLIEGFECYEEFYIPDISSIKYAKKEVDDWELFINDRNTWIENKLKEYDTIYNNNFSRYESRDNWIANQKPYGTYEDAIANYERESTFSEKYPDLAQNFSKLESFIRSIDEDILYELFGDHARVSIAQGATKFTIEEFEHD